MKRREFFSALGRTTLGLAGAGSLARILSGCSPESGKKWNIVFILSDDHGWNQVGYHGTTYYETPHIDRLASQGMRFTDAYAAAPICSPTRASLMTGKYPARLHLTDYIPGSPYPYARVTTPQQIPCLPLEEVTLAEKFKEYGYITGHFGKWHLAPDYNYAPGRPFDPASQGFDEVLTTNKPEEDSDPESDAHHTIEITERSVQFIEAHKDEPFFCYVAFNAVHRPIMEKKVLVDKYRAKEGADLPVNNPIMGAMLERMDWGIGEIMKKLDDLKLSERTIVVFYSDNGGLAQLQSQYPLRMGKATLYDGGLKVPLCIRWQGVVKPGTVNSTPVTTIDFFPTLLQAVGAPYDAQAIDGVSLLPLLKQQGDLNRSAIFTHYPHYHHLGYKPGSAIREGDFKLIEWYEQSLYGEEHPVSLFNVRQDVGETRDLADEMPEKAAEMREKLHRWRKEVGAQEMTVNPDYDPQKVDWRFRDRPE
jgi:arylsulfatase A-like enzyme